MERLVGDLSVNFDDAKALNPDKPKKDSPLSLGNLFGSPMSSKTPEFVYDQLRIPPDLELAELHEVY